MRPLRFLPAILALSCASAPLAHAQAPYPSKTIRLIVPFPPGGGNDTVARVVGQRLQERLAQNVIVDNRGGAGGNIGMDLASKAAADGHTLVLGSFSTLVINPNVYKGLTFDTIRDFAPITQLASSSLVLAVHPTVPAKTVKETIALAKSGPGRLDYAAGSTAGYLAGELFRMMAGVSIVYVPYKGNALALADLMSGQVSLFLGGVLAVKPHAGSGRLRALAVTGSRRSPTMPELPTIAESALPRYEVDSWYGILAPAKTPRAVIDVLNRELLTIVRADDFRQRLLEQGAAPVGNSPEQFAAYIRSELDRWGKVIRAANVRPD